MVYNFLYLDLVGYTVSLCVFISIWVCVMLIWQFLPFSDVGELGSEDNLTELIWTVIPSFFVMILCLLNLQCLGSDTFPRVLNVLKVVGHQWFWSYEMSDLGNSYDSSMLDFIDSVDKPLRLFYKVPCCLLVTSADVIHSFSLPAFNLKVDAIPGRINQIVFCPDRVGVFVGYCSELCGAGHAYMPIVVEVVLRH